MEDTPSNSRFELDSNGKDNACDHEVVKVEEHGEIHDIPMDGGIRAWSTLLGGFLVTSVTFGYSNAFGVFQDIYTRSHAGSPSSISWIGSTQIFLLFSMGIPAGKMLDQGYFRQTMIAGTIIYIFSMFMVSIAHHDKFYQIYLSQGLGMGIGGGMLYVPAMAIQAHHWRQRRSFALGVVVSGTSAGGIFLPIMLNKLFSGSVGFKWGVRASAFLCLGVLIICMFLMTTNPKILAIEKPKPDMKGILTDLPYMLANLGAFLMSVGIYFPYFYIQLYAILHGMDPNLAFYLLAVMNASSIPGRVLPTIIADKAGPFNLIVPSSLACSVMHFAIFGLHSSASIFVFAVIYGFISGSYLGLCAPAVQILSRYPSESGVRLGISFAFAGIGALIGTPIVGALLRNNFNWSKPITFSGVTAFSGFLLAIWARVLVAKRKGTSFV